MPLACGRLQHNQYGPYAVGTISTLTASSQAPNKHCTLRVFKAGTTLVRLARKHAKDGAVPLLLLLPAPEAATPPVASDKATCASASCSTITTAAAGAAVSGALFAEPLVHQQCLPDRASKACP